MSTENQPQDELAGTEQPFVQHLMELRDRLVKAAIAVGVVLAVLALYPGPAALYDILAQPLVATLPAGGKLIATSVISPFLVPLKIMLMTAFLLALPVVLWQVWAFVAPGLYSHEKKLGAAQRARGGRNRATRAAPDKARVRTPLRALYQCGMAPCFRRHFLFGCL